jgi:hypothetical protein
MSRMEFMQDEHHTAFTRVVNEGSFRIDVDLTLEQHPELLTCISNPSVAFSSLIQGETDYEDLFGDSDQRDLPKKTTGKEKVISQSEFPETGKVTFARQCKNQFICCAWQAFDHHTGFVLSPQQLFLIILQHVALHVNEHPEELRSQFVRFDGKKELIVDLSPSPPPEEWARAMQNLRQQVAENTVPDTHQLFSMEHFSTVTENEKIAGDIALMDVCQKYFDFSGCTLCGIPFFILDGTVEDWESLREKAEQIIVRKTLPEFSARWLPALLPTLDKIIKARKGEENDKAFWDSFFKIGATHGSGSFTYVSGWINCFHPLVEGWQKSEFNPFCQPFTDLKLYKNDLHTEPIPKAVGGRAKREVGEDSEDEDDYSGDEDEEADGPDVQTYSSGFSKVPVKWIYSGEERSLYAYSGFAFGKYDNNAIHPEVAWWITEVV